MNAERPDNFIKFFNSLFPDEETLKTAKYCVSMAISGNSGKRLFQLWQGIGSNGKSTLLETIKNVLGKDKSYKFPSEVLLTGAKRENYKAEIAKFQGKYFCYSSEAEKGARLSQNIIKDMTGDEAISARELYKSPVEFEATWQIIYAVNDLPAIYGDDYAFNDRLIVIPFKMFFYKDEDKKISAIRRGVDEKYLMLADSSKDFKRGLYGEKAGIIKWMIENYNFMNTDLGGVIPESIECKQKKASYIEDNDDIGVFLSEICEIDETRSKGWYMQLEELAEEFREFTGSQKKGTKSIIRDIVESHNCIERGVESVVAGGHDYSGNFKMKQTRVLRNIRLRELSAEAKETRNTEAEKSQAELDDEAIGALFG
jgi:putative DNA primase/helicase